MSESRDIPFSDPPLDELLAGLKQQRITAWREWRKTADKAADWQHMYLELEAQIQMMEKRIEAERK